MKPDIVQGVGGVVDVFDLLKAGEAVIYVVQGNLDGIVYFLLPIVLIKGVGLVHRSVSVCGCLLTETLRKETG